MNSVKWITPGIQNNRRFQVTWNGEYYNMMDKYVILCMYITCNTLSHFVSSYIVAV